MEKYKVGVIGATGMVGQRFVTLMNGHPWFELTTLAASPRSEGLTYEEAVEGRWKMDTPIPEKVRTMVLDGKLSAGHARTLLSLETSAQIEETAAICIESDMSVRSLEKYVAKLLEKKKKPKAENKDVPEVNYFEEIENRLASKFGRKITFRA